MALERLLVRLIGDGKSYRGMMTGAIDQTNKFSKTIDSANLKLKSVGQGVTNLGKGLTIGATLPLVAAGAGFIKAATSLNAAMANVATLGIEGARLQELKADVQDLSITVNKSTTDIAGGLFQVVSAFGDSADTVKILEINAKAATAGLATTTEAINLTSAVTKGYGDTSAEAVQKASDLAFLTNKLGQTTFPELASSLGKVVPLTKAMGVSQEELFGTMATLTGVTGTASEVSTQLRGVMQALMAPTADTTKMLKDQGFESGKAMVEQLGLMGAIKRLTSEADRTGQPLQKYISSIEGQTLALAMTGAQSDVYAEKLKAMQAAGGDTEAAFRAQAEGINAAGFSWGQATQRATVMAQKLGDVLIPIVMKFMDIAEPWVERLTSVAMANQDVTVKIGGIVAAAGPLLFVFGKISTVISGLLIPVVGKFGGLLLAFTNPVTAVIAVVAALVAGLRWLGGSWEGAGQIAANAMDFMADAVITAIRIINRVFVAFIGWLGARFAELWEVDWVKAIVSGIKIAGRKLQEFGVWVAKKLRSLFTGEEAGTLEDFVRQIEGDLRRGAETKDFLETMKQIYGEEIGLLQGRRAGKELLTQGARERLQPVQQKAVELGGKAEDTFKDIQSKIGELVEIARQDLEKEGVELEAVGL